MYRALATDAIPAHSPVNSNRNSAVETTSNGYASRRNLNLVGGRAKSPAPLRNDFHESSTYRLSDFNASRRLVDDANPYGGSIYDFGKGCGIWGLI